MSPKAECVHLPRLLAVFVVVGFATISAQTIPHGTQQTYNFINDVRMYDLKNSHLTTGVQMSNKFTVSSVWNKDNEQLLEFAVDSFKLFTKSSDSRKDQTYKITKSNLDHLHELRFFVKFNNGKFVKLYSQTEKDISLLNLKRALGSLFQFHFKNGITTEKDVSGICSVLYKPKSSTNFEKIKTECSNWALKVHHRKDEALNIFVKSFQDSSYKFDQNGLVLKVSSRESHTSRLQANPVVGSRIESVIKVSHSGESKEVDQLEIEDVDSFLEGQGYRSVGIEAEVDGNVNPRGESLKKSIKGVKDEMVDGNYGKFISSLILADLVVAVREAKTDELLQILKAHTVKDIKSQIIDAYAAAQTVQAHHAITNAFSFDNHEHFLDLERYVQGLSIGTRPKAEIIDDLFKKLNDKIMSDPKLEQSVVQALGAMCYNFAQLASEGFDDKEVKQIREYFVSEVGKCKMAHCKEMYIRGLQNLRDPKTIPLLVDTVLKGDRATSVVGMKALRAFDIKHFNEDHKKMFEKVFYQVPKRFDSSVRTLALDMLFDFNPTADDFKHFMEYLKSNDKEFEVKTYLLQRLYMNADDSHYFREQFRRSLAKDPKANNFNVLAPKGITTALRRQFSAAPSFNASLLSFQEIKTGVLKRGVVDLILESGENALSAFKLELLTSGLDSFMSSNSEDDADEEVDSNPTAGMEITVQGTLLRPIQFFNGKSELMGHVWSGTASDPTPAYQATTLLHDHEEYIILQNGGTVYVKVLSAASIDLNGQVQISLWNRNAHCQVDKNTGLAIIGSMSYGTSYVYLQNKFTITQEPKINVEADLDFYSDVLLCTQLGVPESTLWHNIVKVQNIKGTKNLVQNTVNVTYEIPGKTLALNRKNNQMCNIILGDKDSY